MPGEQTGERRDNPLQIGDIRAVSLTVSGGFVPYGHGTTGRAAATFRKRVDERAFAAI
jgi:hypothetical protein